MFNVLDKGINNYEIIDAPSDEATLILAESTCGLYYWFEKWYVEYSQAFCLEIVMLYH